MLKVCYFGSYLPEYSRNYLTRRAFFENGEQVVDCRDVSGGVGHYFRLVRKFLNPDCRESDIIFVAVLGHFDVPLAWVLAKIFKKKLVFDAFYSLYDTYVGDRKSTKKISFDSMRFSFYDWLSVSLADKVLLDTEENINYIVKRYGSNRKKFYELPVTADPKIFKKIQAKQNKPLVFGFYGSFLPLHGIDIVIEAVEKIKDEEFTVVLLGKGPGLNDTRQQIADYKLSHKIKLSEKNVPYNELPKFLSSIDILMGGPFGNSGKAKRVLPAKIVESLSAGVPVIVMETPSTVRLLQGFSQVFWLDKNDPDSLASLIRVILNKEVINVGSNSNDFEKGKLGFLKFKTKLKTILNA